jgi:hypothetical protein
MRPERAVIERRTAGAGSGQRKRTAMATRVCRGPSPQDAPGSIARIAIPIARDGDGGKLREQLTREARATARFSHPKVLDFNT